MELVSPLAVTGQPFTFNGAVGLTTDVFTNSAGNPATAIDGHVDPRPLWMLA